MTFFEADTLGTRHIGVIPVSTVGEDDHGVEHVEENWEEYGVGDHEIVGGHDDEFGLHHHDHEVGGHDHEARRHDQEIRRHDHDVKKHDHEIRRHDHEVKKHDHEVKKHDHEVKKHDLEVKKHDLEVKKAGTEGKDADGHVTAKDVNEEAHHDPVPKHLEWLAAIPVSSAVAKFKKKKDHHSEANAGEVDGGEEDGILKVKILISYTDSTES
jgi:hypothetical protein